MEAGVDPGQVRRGLTVAERGEPQRTELTLTDAEGRHAGNANGRFGRVKTVRGYENGSVPAGKLDVTAATVPGFSC